MKWIELRSSQIGALSRDTVLVLPTAAVEQHGPHLPVGTDSLIAEGIADRLDKVCSEKLLVLPVQKLGCSEHHMKFPGTLSISHEAFKITVMDTLSAVMRQGFRRVLILNAHGGNQSVGGVIAEKAAQSWPEAEVIFASWWRVAADRIERIAEGDLRVVGHACEFETSLMLALHPKLVDMKLAVDDGIPPNAPQLRIGHGTALQAIPFDRLTKHGVYGHATLGTAEKGERVLREVTIALQELISSVWPAEKK
jgi:creatinine amidohydrolase